VIAEDRGHRDLGMKAGAEKAESENLKDSIHGGSGSARLNIIWNSENQELNGFLSTTALGQQVFASEPNSLQPSV
jgi:hypothetical protein